MFNKRLIVFFMMAVSLLSGCYRPDSGALPWKVSGGQTASEIMETGEAVNFSGGGNLQPEQIWTPTPNPPIELPTPRSESLMYTVESGDTLRKISLKYQVSIAELVRLNGLTNPDLIDVGQVLVVPPPTFDAAATAFKIIPDSELVNSPSNYEFNVDEFVATWGGYLGGYSEDIDGVNYSGAAVVARVATEYSVNPRLLLAFLEYGSQWVTNSNPAEETLKYPMGYFDPLTEGLYRQLGWAANLLNEGYYLWKLNGITIWLLSDGSVVEVEPTINPGTAGVLNLLRYLTTKSDWEAAISENGIYDIYVRFFGYPFFNAIEPMIPDDLAQPSLQLPFEKGQTWSFTGGPHGGWNTGSAWAAIDFAPPGEALGCFPSEAWVVASAPGTVVYSDHGAVIQDLDDDGVWQTGWSIFYMHIDTWDRVEVGTYLDAGDRVGHPSCEGGFSTGTHLHIARRYNGEWIAADGDLPLNLEGWVASGYGIEYDGYLTKGDQIVEAWNGRSPLNAIER